MASFIRAVFQKRKNSAEKYLMPEFDNLNDLKSDIEEEESPPAIDVLSTKAEGDEPKQPLGDIDTNIKSDAFASSRNASDLLIKGRALPSKRPSFSESTPATSTLPIDTGVTLDEGLDELEVLFSRVRHNRYEYVAAVLDAGTAATVVDDNGNTLLHVCAQNNLKKMAALVIRNGCALSARNKKGFTPLDYCAMYSFYELRDWLLSMGASFGQQGTLDNKQSDRGAVRRSSMR